jgi:hypothetical protein
MKQIALALSEISKLYFKIRRGVKDGTIPVRLVIDALEALVLGVNKELKAFVWKTVLIGGVSKKDLAKISGIGPISKSIITGKGFKVFNQSVVVDTITLTSSDLGYTKKVSINKIILDTKRLNVWGKKNLKGYVLEICPAEIGPHLRQRYQDQSVGSALVISMEPIADQNKNPRVFCLSNKEGLLQMVAVDAMLLLDPDIPILFCLKRTMS